jgi:hypothetical protein
VCTDTKSNGGGRGRLCDVAVWRETVLFVRKKRDMNNTWKARWMIDDETTMSDEIHVACCRLGINHESIMSRRRAESGSS